MALQQDDCEFKTFQGKRGVRFPFSFPFFTARQSKIGKYFFNKVKKKNLEYFLFKSNLISEIIRVNTS